MGKGGTFRTAVPLVSQKSLEHGFKQYVRCVKADFNLGIYDRISRSQAASAAGLTHNRRLLCMLLETCPTGEVQHQQLKSAMLQFPDANDTSLMDSLWAAQKAERMQTLLAHVRRIARDDTRYRQCISKATAFEQECLADLVRRVSADVAPPPRRALEAHVSAESSALSLDEDGFPLMLAEEVEDCEEGSDEQKPEDVDTLLYEDMEIRSPPPTTFDAALAAAALEAAERQAGMTFKRPAAAPIAGVKRPATAAADGKYVVTKATRRSYIQEKVGNKLLCVVNCTARMVGGHGKDHREVIAHVHFEVLSRSMSKDEAAQCKGAHLAA